MHPQKTAIIIGAGPAGLTAALEFCRNGSVRPIVLEASDRIGGISCTIRYNGNRIDIGGHRFFSKSDRVMDWWTEIMPIAGAESGNEFAIRYQNQQRMMRISGKAESRGADPECVMLVQAAKKPHLFHALLFRLPAVIVFGNAATTGIHAHAAHHFQLYGLAFCSAEAREDP
jgi:hypothetical protein